MGVGAVVARCHALAATVVGWAWESGTTVVRVVGLFVRWSGLGVLLAVKSGSSAAKQGRSSRAKADCKCSHLMLSALQARDLKGNLPQNKLSFV